MMRMTKKFDKKDNLDGTKNYKLRTDSTPSTVPFKWVPLRYSRKRRMPTVKTWMFSPAII